MKELNYTIDKVDTYKSKYGPGPWQEEKDLYLWSDRGYICLIRRTSQLGTLCGYVGLTPDHVLFKYDLEEIDCHGGVTFDSQIIFLKTLKEYHPILLDFADVRFVGFDCAHGGDLIPCISKMFGDTSGTYKNVDYVRVEILKMISQLETLKNGTNNND